jgi:hypothetical protein
MVKKFLVAMGEDIAVVVVVVGVREAIGGCQNLVNRRVSQFQGTMAQSELNVTCSAQVLSLFRRGREDAQDEEGNWLGLKMKLRLRLSTSLLYSLNTHEPHGSHSYVI